MNSDDAAVVAVLRERNWSRVDLARELAAERMRLAHTAKEYADRGVELEARKEEQRAEGERLEALLARAQDERDAARAEAKALREALDRWRAAESLPDCPACAALESER